MSKWINRLNRVSEETTRSPTLKTLETGSEGFEGASPSGSAPNKSTGSHALKTLKTGFDGFEGARPSGFPANSPTSAEAVTVVGSWKDGPANDSRRQPEIPPSVLALCGLDDQEITRMARRVIAIKRAGYSLDDSEVIADALLLRDRTGLDMHACLECDHLLGRRCTARPAQSFDPRDMHELRRCPAYVPAKD